MKPLRFVRAKWDTSFGEPVTEQWLYTETHPSYLGCDSTHNIALSFWDTAVGIFEPGGLGCSSPFHLLTVEISGATPLMRSREQWATTATPPPFLLARVFGNRHRCLWVPECSRAAKCMISFLCQGGSGQYPASCFEKRRRRTDRQPLRRHASSTNTASTAISGKRRTVSPVWRRVFTVFMRDKEECENMFSVTVSEPAPLGIRLPGDTTLRLGDSLRITPLSCPECLPFMNGFHLSGWIVRIAPPLLPARRKAPTTS